MKKINVVFWLMAASVDSFAQTEQVKATVPDPSIGLSTTEVLIVSLLVFSIALLVVTIVLFNAFKVFYKERNNLSQAQPIESPKPLDYEEWVRQKKSKPNIWTKLLSLKPIEEEKELIIPHAYDDIHELNNPIPRWFNVLFYGTLIFAVVYLYYYHVGGGPMQDQEYETEMVKAAKEKVAFLARSSEKYDETTVKVDAAMIENGKMVYNANCTACHGEHGQGIVGPNLTDEFWLHGGAVGDIFKTIKYGVLDKGMTSWEKNLSSKKIAEVTNYILSLRGTNPPNAKAPQGQKFVAESTTDSLTNEGITKK